MLPRFCLYLKTLRFFSASGLRCEILADPANARLAGFTNRRRHTRIGHGAHYPDSNAIQLLLLPEAVDDYIGVDNPVRFIDAFVDGLDLVEAGFARVQPKATGRPGYAPGDLLKLYIYGYLNRVRSSRRLEAECHRNIEVIWLLRTLKPDFKTIADFRADNRAAFKAVFRRSRCCASGSICSVASCWRWTERGSRRSTTRIAISPAIRWRNSSRPPTSGWRITSSGSTRATRRKRRRAARG